MSDYFSSRFHSFGLFEFSGSDTLSRKLFDQITESLGSGFAQTDQAAETYADATCLAIAQLQIECAAAQSDPEQSNFLIDQILYDYGTIVRSDATLSQKRAALAVAIQSAWQCLIDVIKTGLTNIFGDGFYDAEFTDWSAVTLPTETPVMVPPSTPIKLMTLTPIPSEFGIFPGSQTLVFTRILDAGNPIVSGDKLFVEPENLAACELVDVTASTLDSGGLTGTITATFTKCHTEGCIATTASHPMWWSGRSHLIVALLADVFEDSELIGYATLYLRKILPATCTWCFALSNGIDPIEDVGPFTVGAGLVGRTPLNT